MNEIDRITRESLRILHSNCKDLRIPSDLDVARDMAKSMEEFAGDKETFKFGEWKEWYKSRY